MTTKNTTKRTSKPKKRTSKKKISKKKSFSFNFSNIKLKDFLKGDTLQFIVGVTLLAIALFMILSFMSYMFDGCTNLQTLNSEDSEEQIKEKSNTFLPEEKFTLKKDVVDSAHSNNNAIAVNAFSPPDKSIIF